AAKDRPITLKLLRGGKPVTVPVTAAMRKVEAPPTQEASLRVLLTAQPDLAGAVRYRNFVGGAVRYRNALAQPGSDDLRQRLEQVEKELNAVRAALDKINETLKADKGSKRD